MEEYQEILTEVFKKSKDKTVKGAAETANQYTEVFKNGVIDTDEYTKLMSFIIDTNQINRNVKNIKFMDDMNDAITNLIDIANK
jgi:hypothetical protein